MSRPVGERYLRWTSVINEEMKAELFTEDFLTQTAAAERAPTRGAVVHRQWRN